MAEDVRLYPSIQGLRLEQLCSGGRFSALDMLDAYGQGTQYDACQHDWDGRFRGYGPDADISPGWYVPLAKRRPATRFDLAKLINRRLTAMVFGAERWPEINCDGDPEAEDYTKALAQESKLHSKMLEARDRGGACGTACVSFKYLDGKPRVTVHDAKHIHVLRWVDRDDFVISQALKAYKYEREVWTPDGRRLRKTYFFARLWTETTETVWDPIPLENARAGNWSYLVPSKTVEHGYGEAPIYWTQNLPDSEREDGVSDFAGACDTIDSLNHLLSALTKGTIANVDPTLVIKDDPGKNTGVVRKGSGVAIYSKGGADYLEISGESVRAALEEVKAISQMVLDVAGVVLGDPDKMASKAQSGAALKMLYLPMLNQCDQLRTQYGELLLRVLRGMLRAARMISQSPPGPIEVTADGRRVQTRPIVILPPRVEVFAKGHNRADATTQKPRLVERTPGTGEHLALSWPAYFKATAEDVFKDVQAANEARGKLIGNETAVKHVAHHFGVSDTQAEAEEIEEQRQKQLEEMAGPDDGMFPKRGNAKPEDDDED